MLLLEGKIDLICDANDARVGVLVQATAKDSLNERGEGLLVPVELIDFVDDHDVVALLSMLNLPKLLICHVFLLRLDLTAQGFGYLEGELLIVVHLATYSIDLRASLILSNLL